MFIQVVPLVLFLYCHSILIHCFCFLFNGFWVHYLTIMFYDLVCENNRCFLIWQTWLNIFDHIYIFFTWFIFLPLLSRARDSAMTRTLSFTSADFRTTFYPTTCLFYLSSIMKLHRISKGITTVFAYTLLYKIIPPFE